MNENKEPDKKERNVIDIATAKKAMQDDKNIDLNNPVMTVYGIQMLIDGVLQGTSLYSSQGKAVYVKNQMEEVETQRQQTAIVIGQKIPRHTFKQINYLVY